MPNTITGRIDRIGDTVQLQTKDGKTYVFAEFGITDRTFQGYGEIYTVDVERNAYVPNGVFITKPSPATAGKNGRNIYDELIERSGSFLSSYE